MQGLKSVQLNVQKKCLNVPKFLFVLLIFTCKIEKPFQKGIRNLHEFRLD